MKKRILSILLIFACLFALGMPNAIASNSSEIEPYYTGLSRVTLSLDISDTILGKLSKSYAFVTLYDGFTADVTLELQRSSTGTSNWNEIKTWEDSGADEIEIEEQYFVVEGYYYRVAALIYVYYESGGLAEVITKYSPVQQA